MGLSAAYILAARTYKFPPLMKIASFARLLAVFVFVVAAYAGTILAGAIGRQFRVDYADVVNVGTTN